MQPPNQASQRLTSFRTLLSSADAGATSFDDFEEVLAQELHDVEDWMSLSRPAIEVFKILYLYIYHSFCLCNSEC